MENVLSLAGVVAFFVVLLNILAAVGVITGESKEKLAGVVHTLVQIALTLVGIFAPDLMNWFPMIDQAAELMAELGALVLLAIPLIKDFAGIFHDFLTMIPGLDKSVGFQLSK